MTNPIVEPTPTIPLIETVADLEKYLASFATDERQCAILLDYDGTLAPITAHPDFTMMSDETEASLTKLANNPKVFVAIISGRSVPDVKGKVGIDSIVYGGNHGLDILSPNGTMYNYPIPEENRNNFLLLIDVLRDKLARNGAWVENKKVSLTFHYREAPETMHLEMAAEAKEIIKSYGFRAHQAHCAVEARPPVEWNKGKAALYILESSFGKNWDEKVKILFAGDDMTDEDAMTALKGKAISFRISKKEIQSKADYRLLSTESVTNLLQWVETHV